MVSVNKTTQLSNRPALESARSIRTQNTGKHHVISVGRRASEYMNQTQNIGNKPKEAGSGITIKISNRQKVVQAIEGSGTHQKKQENGSKMSLYTTNTTAANVHRKKTVPGLLYNASSKSLHRSLTNAKSFSQFKVVDQVAAEQTYITFLKDQRKYNIESFFIIFTSSSIENK